LVLITTSPGTKLGVRHSEFRVQTYFLTMTHVWSSIIGTLLQIQNPKMLTPYNDKQYTVD